MSENQLSSIVKNMVKDQIPDAIKEKIGLDRESLKQKYGENLFNNLRIVGSNEEINWSYSSDDEKIFDYIGGSGYFNDKDEFIPNDVKMMITKEIVGQGGEEYVLHEFALGDENLLESLEICQKSLGKYPEEKRIFYFENTNDTHSTYEIEGSTIHVDEGKLRTTEVPDVYRIKGQDDKYILGMAGNGEVCIASSSQEFVDSLELTGQVFYGCFDRGEFSNIPPSNLLPIVAKMREASQELSLDKIIEAVLKKRTGPAKDFQVNDEKSVLPDDHASR